MPKPTETLLDPFRKADGRLDVPALLAKLKTLTPELQAPIKAEIKKSKQDTQDFVAGLKAAKAANAKVIQAADESIRAADARIARRNAENARLRAEIEAHEAAEKKHAAAEKKHAAAEQKHAANAAEAREAAARYNALYFSGRERFVQQATDALQNLTLGGKSSGTSVSPRPAVK